jgi:hypothetical protein
MKNLIKHLAVITTILALTAPVMAGECCTKAADKAKKGEACAQCTKGKCCKNSIEKLGKDAKPCTKCAKK